MASAYLVTLPASPGFTLEYGKNAVVVYADSAADAKIMAEYASTLDAADWADATATAIAAPSDLEDWQFRVQVMAAAGAAGTAPITDVTYTAIALDDLDAVGDALVVALNAAGPMAAAAYTTPTLTIAAAGDALGDQKVRVGAFPPGADTSMNGAMGKYGIDSFLGALTDGGASGAALTLVLTVATAVPNVPVLVKA
jgi:hypothetical protein